MYSDSLENHATCPSAKCKTGADLLGVVNEEGKVDMLHTPFKIDQAFVTTARQNGIPESRFRFAKRCVTSGCVQWTGEKCGVIEKIMTLVNETVAKDSLPVENDLKKCSIRSTCRWFSQRGPEACAVCTLVVTDISGQGK